MFKRSSYIIRVIFVQLVLVGSLFCILFGQGAHLHDIAFHVGDHFDIHAHIHAHENQADKPFQSKTNPKKHQHKVNTTSNIIGTLNFPLQVKIDIKAFASLTLDIDTRTLHKNFQDVPSLFDLPPPRPVSHQYYLSSFSRRGPPIA